MWTDELNDQYIKLHMQIVTECLRHVNETGYLTLRIDDCFCLVEDSIQFHPGDFDRDQFTVRDISKVEIPSGMVVRDAFFIYFSVIGADNISRLNVRKMIIQLY